MCVSVCVCWACARRVALSCPLTTVCELRIAPVDDVVAAYEAVADAAPADAGMQQNLFFMFVRLGRYREAQTAALSRIHSVSKDTQHMMWAIVAVSLQGGLEGNNMYVPTLGLDEPRACGWMIVVPGRARVCETGVGGGRGWSPPLLTRRDGAPGAGS